MPIELLTNIALEAEPDDPSHLVSVSWVTDFVLGKIKSPVRLVATTPLAGTYTAPTFELGAAGHLSVDGIQVAVGDRILLVGQTGAAATQNGIYTVEDTGNGGPAELQRATDFDESSKIYSGVSVTVREGTQHSSTTWKLITDGTITLDTTALEFITIHPVAAASKWAEDIVGDDTAIVFPITHNLLSTDVSVSIRNLNTNGIVLADVTVNNANMVTIGFDKAPSPAQHFRVVVMG